MMEEGLKNLEDAARILLESPNNVTGQQRHVAETEFLNFRAAKHPIGTIVHILNHSKVDYVIYQAACGLKESLIKEWTKLDKTEIASLQNYLLDYVTTNKILANYVKEQIFQVLGVIVKRAGIDGDSENKECILNAVEMFIKSNDLVMQNNACSILKMILNEYMISSKSSEIGMAWEAHFSAKKIFEETDLRRIFRFLLMVLNEFEKCPMLSQESWTLLERFFTVTELILCWNFMSNYLPKRLAESSESEPTPPLRPGAAWKDILLDKEILDLFFKLHWKVRNNENVVHHSMNCLSQLASLHGLIFPNRETRYTYLIHFLDGLIKLMDHSAVNLVDYEALGIANIINKLSASFPPVIFEKVPQNIVEAFVKSLSNLTCLYMCKAIVEQVNNDELMFSEALDLLLQVWIPLLTEMRSPQCAQYDSAAAMIFEVYLQCHLSPPKGKRPQTICSAGKEEIQDVEENDRVKFNDELAMIGRIARCCLSRAIPLIVLFLEEKVEHLRTFLKSTQEHNYHSDPDNMFEDLHWLMLIAGHVIALVSDGEKPIIPPSVMQYSIRLQTSSTIQSSVQILDVTRDSGVDPAVLNDSDAIVRLVVAVFRLCELQKCAVNAKLESLLSPEVCATLMWFLHRWALTYLFADESYYTQISPSLNQAFGQDSPSAFWCLNYVMDQINVTLTAWVGEPEVILQTVDLLLALVDDKERANRVAKSNGLWEIVRNQMSTDFALSHSIAKQRLVKALVMAGTAAPDVKAVEEYCVEVLKSVEERFKSVILRDDFCSSFHNEVIKKQILHGIDCFIGVIHGSNVYNSQYIFAFVYPLVNELVPLLRLYHNYQDVVVPILQCYREFAKCLLCFLNREESKKFYQSCINMIQSYTKANIGKRNFEASAEDEQCDDLLLLMDLLINLLSKDFLDLNDGTSGIGVCVGDVILFSLNIIMPLMSAELLRYPRLCLRYYKMITNVCEFYPEKICQLPEDLFKNVIASLQIGFTIYGREVSLLCLSAVTAICRHIFKAQLTNSFCYGEMKLFLRVVFEMLLSHGSTFSDLAVGCSTLFVLICCYQDQFQKMVNEFLQEQAEKHVQDRLLLALQNLMDGVQFTDDRKNQLKFKNQCEKFIVEVRSFLFVK